MHNRYRKPAPPPPRLEFLEAYLRDAQPTLSERLVDPEAIEARRVKGVSALLVLARAALAEAGDRNRLGAIPGRVRHFLTIEGLRILMAEDPIAALQWFLGHKPPQRGRPPADNTFRDHMIAADVAELYASGKSIEAACKTVSKRPGTPGRKRIEEIYLRLRDDLAVRAELELRSLRTAGKPDDPASPKIEGQEISPEQFQEYLALIAAECPNGMTAEDNLELWGFVRRASFPT